MARRGQPTKTVVPGNTVRLRNIGDQSFRGRYRQEWYQLSPNSEAFIEYGAAVAWLGNPLTADTAKNKERSREFHRIKLMHMGAESVYNNSEWESRRPQLECYTLEGQRFYMVADDPKGVTVVNMEDPTPDRMNQQLLTMMSTLQAFAAKMREQGLEVDLPELNPVINPIIPSADPNQIGSINAPINLSGGEPTIESHVNNSMGIPVDNDPDDIFDDDVIPIDSSADAIRRVIEVPVDDVQKQIRTVSGGRRHTRKEIDLGED